MPQPHTTDHPIAPRGRDEEHRHTPDSKDTIDQLSFFLRKMHDIERHYISNQGPNTKIYTTAATTNNETTKTLLVTLLKSRANYN